MATSITNREQTLDDHAIRLIIQFKIKPGKLGEFRKTAGELTVDTLATELRTQSYEWYLSADHGECWISERFLDSEAALLHSDNVVERLKLLTLLADIKEVLLLGSPSPELHRRMEAIGARMHKPFSGFCR